MKLNRSWIIVAGVVIIAVILTYNMLSNYLNPISVVVAKYDLTAGSRLTSDLLELKEIPEDYAPDGVYTAIEDVSGKVLTTARAAGDFITAYVAGETEVAAGIPSVLGPGHVAIAVKVDQATGLIGTVRSGQRVTIIGIIDPTMIAFSRVNNASGDSYAYYSGGELVGDGEIVPAITAIPEPTPTPQPPVSPVASISITGLKVLVVPQSFRYEEVPEVEGSQELLFANARTTLAGQEGSVVLLEVPLEPIEVAPGYFVSPAVLLPLLNQVGFIHMALEPAGGLDPSIIVNTPITDLSTLFEQLTGLDLNQ